MSITKNLVKKSTLLPPLVIIGPTASGKSSLAMSLAQKHGNVELVSADAKAVYKGMDIGTAKPSIEDQKKVPHHLLSVVEPSQLFAVAEFQTLAQQALKEIEQRNNAAIIVGGTGLYVRAVVDDFSMPPNFPEVREELEQEPDTAHLWKVLNESDPVAAAKMKPTNRSRIVRALEVVVGSGQPFSSFGPGVDAYPESSYCQIGLRINRQEMDRRIDARYDAQMEAGFLAEVEVLSKSDLSRTAAQALGYRELLDHLQGDLTLEEALLEAKKKTKKFARRQQRWFRRDPRIKWFESDAADLVEQVQKHWTQAAVNAQQNAANQAARDEKVEE